MKTRVKVAVGFVAAIVVALGVLIYADMHRINHDRVVQTVKIIQVLLTVLEDYKEGVGQYPTESEGLEVALKWSLNRHHGPYLGSTEPPRDSWGQPFRYRLHAGKPWIVSAGPDGIFDTADDLGNKSKRASIA